MKGTAFTCALGIGVGAALAVSAWGQTVGVRGAALARLPLAQTLAADPEIMRALRSKNNGGETAEEIQRKDKEWTQNPQFALRKSLTNSACGQRLRELTKADANVVEVILMDKNGANVCVSHETTDYWQGDEAKFQKTFGETKDVFVDEARLDQSTGVYSIQISVLVRDGMAKAGALTLGLRVNKQEVERRSGFGGLGSAGLPRPLPRYSIAMPNGSAFWIHQTRAQLFGRGAETPSPLYSPPWPSGSGRPMPCRN